MIEGLSHITLLARDLDRMERILTGVLEARRVYDSGGRIFSIAQERFYLVGPEPSSIWLAVMKGEPVARSYQHIAFKIDDAHYDRCLAQVAALKLEIKPPRPRVEGEGRSIYFYDHDHHLFELHAGTLAQRLAAYQRQ
jgi:fosfomycin resistance protein FosX